MTHEKLMKIIDAHYGGVESLLFWISEKLIDQGRQGLSDREWYALWLQKKVLILQDISREIATEHFPGDPGAGPQIQEILAEQVSAIEDNLREAAR